MRYALRVLGLASSFTILLPAVANGQTSCDPAWSPGFEWPFGPVTSAMGKAVEFDDGSGPAIFAISASDQAARAMKYQNGSWKQAGTPFYGNTTGSASGNLYDIAVYNGELYVSGAFRRVGTTGVTGTTGSPSSTTNGIAKWSRTTGATGSWVPTATSGIVAGNTVRALAVQDFGDGPKLYAAGSFNTGTSLAVHNVGTSWTVFPDSLVSGGVPSDLTAHTDSMGTKLLVLGGDFTNVNSVGGTALVAAYNGTAWQSIVPGLNSGGSVGNIESSTGPDHNLFLFGFLIDGWAIARWDGATLHPLSSAPATIWQQVFSVNDGIHPGDSIYFNGLIDSNGTRGLQRWTGTAVEEVVPGSTVLGMGLVGYDPDGAGSEPRRLRTQDFTLGAFQLVDGQWADGLAFPDSRGLNGGFKAMEVYDADGAGPTPARLVCILDGRNTSATFTRQGVLLVGIAGYDGGLLEPFGGGLGDVVLLDPALGGAPVPGHTSALASFNGHLYLGGRFNRLSGNPVGNIIRWNGAAWEDVGGGVTNTLEANFPSHQGIVNCMTVFNNGSGNALYVGGNFDRAGGSVAANYVAKWDGAAWSALGDGLPGPALSLVAHNDGSGLTLFASTTQRTDTPDPEQVGIFKWDGAAWNRIGSSGFLAPTMASFNGQLYIGGSFTSVDSVTYNNIARWDSAAWSAVGTGVTKAASTVGTASVNTLLVGDDGEGPALFIGGRFDNASGVAVRAIAKWDGTSYTSLDAGLHAVTNTGAIQTGTVDSLAFYDDGPGTALFASGSFRDSGSLNTSGLARWGCAAVPCPADFNGSGMVSVQDIFDFLSAYFSNDLAADINNSGAVSVQDIFDFLAAYFSGC